MNKFYEALSEVIAEFCVDNDHWITIGADEEKNRKGTHILVKEGETHKEATERKIKEWKEKDKKEETKETTQEEEVKENNKKIEELETKIEELKKKLKNDNYTIGEKKNFQNQISEFQNDVQDIKAKNAPIEWAEKKKKWDGKIAGVSKGKPMDFAKANNKNANPKYKDGTIYSDNCQTCVVAFELRQRGYDVEARGLDTPEARSLMHYANSAWIDAETGRPPSYIENASIKDNKTLYKWLNATIEPDKRYTLQWGWRGKKKDGHIVSIFKKDNSLILYDPQDGSTMFDKEILNYAKKFKYELSLYGNKMPHPPKLLEVSSYDINFEKVDKILIKATYSTEE